MSLTTTFNTLGKTEARKSFGLYTPIYNNYIEYMIYNNQLSNYNNDNNNYYYNNQSTNTYNRYITQISSNDDTLKTYGTTDNVDTKQHYRKEIKDNRIKINNYNNFVKETNRKFKLLVSYKQTNNNSNTIKEFEIDEIYNLTIKQYKNVLDKTKKIMISFNPIRIYDYDTILRSEDNNISYYIHQIKLIPIDNNKNIIPNKYLPKELFELITNIDNYNYLDDNDDEKIFNSNKFNQILVYYDDIETKELSIQSCSLTIDTEGNIIFKDLNFVKFNKIINFYIDKFNISY